MQVSTMGEALPYVRKTKRRKSISKRAKIVAAVCMVLAAVLTVSGLVAKQHEIRAEAALEAASFTPAPLDVSAPVVSPLAVVRPEGRPLSVLFAGDSITVGHDAKSPSLAFRGLIKGTLDEGGPTEIEVIGNSSRTVADVQPEAAALTAAHDVVFVELGTNDIYKNRPEQFAVDYPLFIETVRASSPDAALVCAGVWQSGHSSAAHLDRIISDACTEAGGRFVSLQSIHRDKSNTDPSGTVLPDGSEADGAHPNNAGHQAIADALLSVVDVK